MTSAADWISGQQVPRRGRRRSRHVGGLGGPMLYPYYMGWGDRRDEDDREDELTMVSAMFDEGGDGGDSGGY
jgi:hypothetical protein